MHILQVYTSFPALGTKDHPVAEISGSLHVLLISNGRNGEVLSIGGEVQDAHSGWLWASQLVAIGKYERH